MHKLFSIWLLFLFSFSLCAQDTLRIKKSELPKALDTGWVYWETSNTNIKALDSAKWKPVEANLRQNIEEYAGFSGQAWFRLKIQLDSNIDNLLSLSMFHYGASKIYLDGKLVKTFGSFGKKKNEGYYYAKNEPFAIGPLDGSIHEIQVLYKNYNAQRNNERFGTNFAGYGMQLGVVNNVFETYMYNSETIIPYMGLLAGLFFTLFFLHLILWLFFKSNKSNLYFSAFTLSLTLLFISFILQLSCHNATLVASLQIGIALLIVACFYSFVAFIHSAFYTNYSIWYKLLLILNAVCLLCCFFLGFKLSALILAITITIDSLYAITATTIALFKKIKGSTIIGISILFFALFFLLLILYTAIAGNLSISPQNTSGQIIIYALFVALLGLPFSMSIYLAKDFAETSKNLKKQLNKVKELSQEALEKEKEKQALIESQNVVLEKRVKERTRDLVQEKRKSDELLLNILPKKIAEELKEKGESEARLYKNATVLFTDFVSFTGISQDLSPKELVREVHEKFTAFDAITEKYKIEKIKTIGDAYMAVSGLTDDSKESVKNAVMAAIEIKEYITSSNSRFKIRIGLHTGPVVAGIVGVKKYAYDIWGDTVNTASRIEGASEPNKINISESTYQAIKDYPEFNFVKREEKNLKGKGNTKMWFVEKA